MLQQLIETDKTDDLMERLHTYGIRRRDDGDYSAAVFRCPTHPDHRQYQSVKVPQAGTRSVIAYCFWCDRAGRVRGQDRDFDRDFDQAQPHTYPLTDGGDDA